jgi:methionyl-tRNA synthetase
MAGCPAGWCSVPGAATRCRPRKQIVAGIRQHYAPEQLVGKTIVVVNNLAPAILRGETSNGMLLAASSGDKVMVLTVDDPDCAAGAKVK